MCCCSLPEIVNILSAYANKHFTQKSCQYGKREEDSKPGNSSRLRMCLSVCLSVSLSVVQFCSFFLSMLLTLTELLPFQFLNTTNHFPLCLCLCNVSENDENAGEAICLQCGNKEQQKWNSRNGKSAEGSMRNEGRRMRRLKTVYIRRFNISEIVEMLRIFVFVFFLSLLLLFIFFGWYLSRAHAQVECGVCSEGNTKIAEGMKCQRAATRVGWQWANCRKEGKEGKGSCW